MPLLSFGIVIIRTKKSFAGAVATDGMFECAGGEVRHAHGKPHKQHQHQHTAHGLKGATPAMHGIGHHTKEHARPDQPDLRKQWNNEIKDIVVLDPYEKDEYL